MKIEIEIRKIDGLYEITCEKLGIRSNYRYIKDAFDYLNTSLYLGYLMAKKDKDSDLNNYGKRIKQMFLEIDE